MQKKKTYMKKNHIKTATVGGTTAKVASATTFLSFSLELSPFLSQI